MAKWIFAALLFLGAGAQANGLTQQSGGCIVFNEIIYEEVTASGWGMTGADLVFTNFRDPSVVMCNDTTQSMSAEFTRATVNDSDRSTLAGKNLSDGAARTGTQVIRDY